MNIGIWDFEGGWKCSKTFVKFPKRFFFSIPENFLNWSGMPFVATKKLSPLFVHLCRSKRYTCFTLDMKNVDIFP